MPYSKAFRSNLIALIDAINELKYSQSIIYSALDILSGDSGTAYTIQKRFDYGCYLLSLYETELKTIMEEIEDIYNELEKMDKC